MSSHADTIRFELERHAPNVPEKAFAALDALLAEQQWVGELNKALNEQNGRLVAENQQLRREVEHLRALLARRDDTAAVRVEER